MLPDIGNWTRPNETLINELLLVSNVANTFASDATKRLCLESALRIQWQERLLREAVRILVPIKNGDETLHEWDDLRDWLKTVSEGLR